MPARDSRPWFRVTVGAVDHPKIEPLTDAAFRLLIRVWDRNKKHGLDGHIDEFWWQKQKPKARAELIDAGLVDPALADGGVVIHDNDEHQETRETQEAAKAKKVEAGQRGAHQRWHTDHRDPDCRFCQTESRRHGT